MDLYLPDLLRLAVFVMYGLTVGQVGWIVRSYSLYAGHALPQHIMAVGIVYIAALTECAWQNGVRLGQPFSGYIIANAFVMGGSLYAMQRMLDHIGMFHPHKTPALLPLPHPERLLAMTTSATPRPVPTQVRRPWRATLRTAVAAFVALCAMLPLLVDTVGLDETLPPVAGALTITAAITRVMALPATEAFLQRFVPFLAAVPRNTDV